MTPTEYTFRIEEDDQIRDVVVPLTFDDLPVDVIHPACSPARIGMGGGTARLPARHSR